MSIEYLFLQKNFALNSTEENTHLRLKLNTMPSEFLVLCWFD